MTDVVEHGFDLNVANNVDLDGDSINMSDHSGDTENSANQENPILDLNAEANMELNAEENMANNEEGNESDEENMIVLGLPAAFPGPDGFLPEEIQEADLMDNFAEENDIQDDQGAQVQDVIHQNIQLGVMQILYEPIVDPIFESFINADAIVPWQPKQNANGVRLWAKFFSPMGASRVINIPQSWADFFTVIMLSPGKFDWAKAFLLGKAWDLVTAGKNEPFTGFQIPNVCPTESKLDCMHANDKPDEEPQDNTICMDDNEIQRETPMTGK